MMYDKEQINELCDHFNLVEYVEQDYELIPRGDEYAMHCPCHKDVHPSMYLNEKKNSFYCHSCRKSGGPIQWLMGVEKLTYKQSIDKLSRLTGLDIRPTETASSFRFFKSIAALADRKIEIVNRQILTEDYLNQFSIPADGEPHEWIEEGIPQDMIRKYHIMLDDKSNRIVYPVYDNSDNLIGAKGRTRFDSYKILGITKYMNYTKIQKTDFFQGMHENRQAIIDSGECIVVEGLKSCMKIDSFGQHNVVAAETSLINNDQAEILIRMRIKDCVLAFDQDVGDEDIIKSADKIKRFMNVWVVKDKNGLLGDKSNKRSPCDLGNEIWWRLYAERQMII